MDFSTDEGTVTKALDLGKKLIVLDHHKTAIEMFDRMKTKQQYTNLELNLDINRSGATIARDYFAERLGGPLLDDSVEAEKVGRMFKYIEDGDLWKWQIPDSKAFSSGFADLGLEFDYTKNPSIFETLLALDPDAIIKKGKESLAKKQMQIQQEVDKSFEILVGDVKFLAVVTSFGHLRSELGNQLAEKSRTKGLRAIAAVVYQEDAMPDKNNYKVSLRSIGDEDTNAIAQKYGGGGHKNASSFVIPISLFDSWRT
eukprot:CAMPEP_0184674296 /NCGR_PEP_ID=MMETSP0308-20130426/87161_1 /TAXON_ID=38269 /ORGANISM="Gloeochaete witrockiana, Strain SAG 46.84" /LENGTH=255 /DNA_ID=CAMNT_0027121885 /DNA_START=315 /DNA_END=1082 /DNA_ORIENTATION=-